MKIILPKIFVSVPAEAAIDKKGIKINFFDREGKKLAPKEVLKKGTTRFYNYFLDFQLLLLTWAGIIPFWNVRRFFYRLCGVKIGKTSHIHIGCRFFKPAGIAIGEGTTIGDNCFLDGRAPLIIGNHVDIASQVLFYNSKHDIDSVDFRAVEAPITIEDYVFIGPRAIIMPGVKIGKGAVVAAAAVVTCDVGSFEVVGGVPAKLIRERKNKNPNYILGRPRLFQ